MALTHASMGLLSALFLAFGTLMLFFIILGGVTDHTPLRHTYFMRADTSGMTGARDISQWTYFYVCGKDNLNCGRAHAAMPFGRPWDSHATNVPDSLIGKYGDHTTSFYYFYMWRFAWVFYMISLFFTACAFFTSFLSCCGRLGAGVGSLVTAVALFFVTIAVCMMTATFARARHVFRKNGRSASLGAYAFGFSWAAWTALFIALVLLCIGTRKSSKDKNNNPEKRERGYFRGRSAGSRRSRGNGSFSKPAHEDRLSASTP